MKFSLIAAVVVLALAQGSYAQDAPFDLANLGQYLENMKVKLVQDLTTLMNSENKAADAQTYLTEMQAQFQTMAQNVAEQVQPLAASAQVQIEPKLAEFRQTVEAMIEKFTQPKAVGN